MTGTTVSDTKVRKNIRTVVTIHGSHYPQAGEVSLWLMFLLRPESVSTQFRVAVTNDLRRTGTGSIGYTALRDSQNEGFIYKLDQRREKVTQISIVVAESEVGSSVGG